MNEKETMMKLLNDMKARYIDEWGSDPECLYVTHETKSALGSIDIKDSVLGVPIIPSSNVKAAQLKFSGNVGERH